MKVITIKEPWASLILEGKKTIETRTWKTKHRGLILLHAAKEPKSKISGKIFGYARIIDIKPMVKDDEVKACCEIYPKAYSWFLEFIPLENPVDCVGMLGLFELPERLRPLFFEELEHEI